MKRYGRILRLKPGAEQEYERLHQNIWPEVAESVRQAGITNYTIFRYGQWLFSYFELPDERDLGDVAQTATVGDACRKWEQLMRNYLEPLPESPKDNWWVAMEEVWRLGG